MQRGHGARSTTIPQHSFGDLSFPAIANKRIDTIELERPPGTATPKGRLIGSQRCPAGQERLTSYTASLHCRHLRWPLASSPIRSGACRTHKSTSRAPILPL